MRHQLHLIIVMVLFFFALSGCSTHQNVPEPAPEPQLDPVHLATAERFLQNIGAGEIAMLSFQKEMQQVAIEQPGMAELTRRAYADLETDDFEEIAARIYARHLSYEHLSQLEKFSEKPAINRFFKVVFEMRSSGKEYDHDELTARFDADELTDIMKFAQSESFLVMTEKLPEINRELADAGTQLGEDLLREYIKSQQ